MPSAEAWYWIFAKLLHSVVFVKLQKQQFIGQRRQETQEHAELSDLAGGEKR